MMSKKTLIIVFVAVLAVIATLVIANKAGTRISEKRAADKQEQVAASPEIALGKPCDFRGGAIDEKAKAIPQGLQCYFYGEVGASGSRPAVWISPDMSQIHLPGVDFNRPASWKTYTNSKLGIAFDYPGNFKAVEGGFKDPGVVNVVNQDGEMIFGLNALPNTVAPSYSEDMLNFMASSNAAMNKIGFSNQHGLEGMAYVFQPKTSLEWPWVLYDLSYGANGSVSVQYNKNIGTDIDYINDAMLQSLRAIK